jgi:hypothetical protein
MMGSPRVEKETPAEGQGAIAWALEHFPAKWMPVCVEKMRQNKEPELSSASMEVEKALANAGSFTPS